MDKNKVLKIIVAFLVVTGAVGAGAGLKIYTENKQKQEALSSLQTVKKEIQKEQETTEVELAEKEEKTQKLKTEVEDLNKQVSELESNVSEKEKELETINKELEELKKGE